MGLNLLKPPTTIAKEVKRNKQLIESTKDCLDCPLLRKATYVCNGGPKRRSNCGYKKTFYLAKQAQR
ncbi:IS30 family transposase, partial [Streptococcus agalactiae]|nr:IS30 family transposase [Streptococcus agalactiae]